MASSFTPQRTTLRSKVMLGFGIVFLMLVLIATISVQSARGFIRTEDWVANAHEAIETEERILRDLAEMESSCRGFLATGDESFLGGYATAQTQIVQGFNSLKAVVGPDGRQAALLDQVQDLLQENFARQ